MTSTPLTPSAGLYPAHAESADTKKRPRLPYFLALLTVFVFSAAILAQVFVSEIEDAVHVGLDVIMVLTIIAMSVLMLLWLGWFLFLSRWSWPKRITASVILVLLPIGFLKIFRPVHGGDTNVVRFEPIWCQRPAPLSAELLPSAGVDLSVESSTDFPRFLGSNQNGSITSGIEIDPVTFASGSKVLWKQPIGLGWSGFSSRNGYAVTMEQRSDLECVTCYDLLNGELKWIYSHPARHRDTINLGRVGPRATPTIHDGRVYAVGAVGNFVCLNGSDGSVVWQKDLNEILGITFGQAVDGDGFNTFFESNTTLAWGRSGAPLIVENTVVVPGGGPAGDKRATLLAFDLLTGELVWKGGKEMIAYGSPVLGTVAGKQQILLTGETLAMGFEPARGDLLWSYARPGQSDGAANTSQVTVISDTDVLISKGYPDGGGDRINLASLDGKTTASPVWQSTRVLKTKLTSPVIYDGHAYSLSNGFMECVNLTDGKQIWKRRGRFGHGQVLLVGHHILLHSESGELFLLDATPDEYRELGVIKTIQGVCWNTLCLTGNRLLVRSEIEAACVVLPVINTPGL